jgi:hypothetical protein
MKKNWKLKFNINKINIKKLTNENINKLIIKNENIMRIQWECNENKMILKWY